jgi:hypothetical protein
MIAQTWRDTNGWTASTISSGTGRTGSDSRASVRPRLRPETAFSAWWVDGSTSSWATAHLNTETIRRTCELMVVLAKSLRIISERTTCSARGVNSLAGMLP